MLSLSISRCWLRKASFQLSNSPNHPPILKRQLDPIFGFLRLSAPACTCGRIQLRA